jgi:type IV pilus assembly protein PilA
MLARIRKSIDENDEGFTLIELLVVIIIIGILAAIAIPVFLNQRKKGYQAGMKSDLRTVADEMETYFTDNQSYIGAAGFAASGATLSAGATANTIGADSVSLSSGDIITLTQVGTSGYCLTATNPTKSTGISYIYDSLKGGLNATSGATCQAPAAYSS